MFQNKIFRLCSIRAGFTLVELLVVIAIIGFLASVAMYSLNSTRVQARDTQRLSDMKAISKALELYYDDNKTYPNVKIAASCVWAGGNVNLQNRWKSLRTILKDNYIALPDDPINTYDNGQFCYIYDSDVQDNNQTYVLSAALEHASNSNLESTDGGWYSWRYELGQQAFYCKQTHNENWWGWGFVCTTCASDPGGC